jgi:hypothetical protein
LKEVTDSLNDGKATASALLVAVAKAAATSIVIAAGDDLLARRPQHDAVLKLRGVAALDVAERGVPVDETIMKRY